MVGDQTRAWLAEPAPRRAPALPGHRRRGTVVLRRGHHAPAPGWVPDPCTWSRPAVDHRRFRDDAHRSGERGSATVWMVMFLGLLAFGGISALALGEAVTVRHRAGSAADLAALAAADHALDGQGAACGRAEVVARAQGARVVACALQGEFADVIVEAHAGAPLLPLPAARVRARAGPSAEPS
jgi:secretion/DNA translocation related TadE-like protein